MLDLIAKMRKDLDILEAFIKTYQVSERVLTDGRKLKLVHRQSKAGDYIAYNETVSPHTYKGKLYEVHAQDSSLDNNYYLDENNRLMYLNGWGDVKPEVYEVVGDEDA